MHPKELRIENYTYTLPDDRVAHYPLGERDASKLLIYRDGEIREDVYRNIPAHIPAGSLMVFNQTRVVNARLLFRKPSGSTIEVFCLAPAGGIDVHTAMLQKSGVQWECLVGGAGKWKHGMVLSLLHELPAFTLTACIVSRNSGAFILSLEWDNSELTFADVLHHAGKVPLPPYLNREAAPADELTYQTTFARDEGSVAAPTAGLHFTPDIFETLSEKEITTSFVTLHVGAGTFRPVKSATMAEHDMHAEWMEVSRETVELLLASIGKREIIAVGTTSLRTVESLYWIGSKLATGNAVNWQDVAVTQWDPYELPAVDAAEALGALVQHMHAHELPKLVTRTQVLIAPGYRFALADGLVTNFHQPRSTLLLLVAAFAGPGWRQIYDYALEHDFRFLSYGDGSLLFLPAAGNQ